MITLAGGSKCLWMALRPQVFLDQPRHATRNADLGSAVAKQTRPTTRRARQSVSAALNRASLGLGGSTPHSRLRVTQCPLQACDLNDASVAVGLRRLDQILILKDVGISSEAETSLHPRWRTEVRHTTLLPLRSIAIGVRYKNPDADLNSSYALAMTSMAM